MYFRQALEQHLMIITNHLEKTPFFSNIHLPFCNFFNWLMEQATEKVDTKIKSQDASTSPFKSLDRIKSYNVLFHFKMQVGILVSLIKDTNR